MRHATLFAIGLSLLGSVLPLPETRARAQGAPVSLVADSVSYDDETGVLTASGNVEVHYEGRVLRARRIDYDQRRDEIRATGPILLTDPGGGVILADAAALGTDLRAGLVQGAQLLIDDELQLAATEVRRSGDRYTTLYRTIASTCTICATNPTPTWALRAARITQDETARRIYFEDATLEVFGLPVGYLPRLSIPDPAVERASGFLAPSFRQSDIYGFGVKLPYYRVLGPSADATVAPFLTTKGGVLVEGAYRRRFDDGEFNIDGVIALNDALGDGAGRGALSAAGAFDIRRGYVALFDLNVASDDSFLAQYDYSDIDLLTSVAGLERTSANEFVSLKTIGFQSLRPEEATGDVPFILPDFTYRRLIDTPAIGGRLGVDLQSLGVFTGQSEDVVRLGGGADWQRNWLLPRGVLASALAATDLSFYRSGDQPGQADGIETRGSPSVGIELRWPLARTQGAAMHVVEPIAQVLYTDTLGDEDVPNEDSTLPEFDTTNLFAVNRFPGLDRIETGLRANLGVSYTRFDPAGWSLGLTFGRVFRAESDGQFPDATGLNGRYSDYVGDISLDFAWGLTLVNRVRFSGDLDLNRNELGLAYEGARGALQAAYVYLPAEDSDPVFGPQPETNEVSLDARYRFLPNWELSGLWRYDVASGSNLRAGAGLVYGNDCAEIDLSVSRRYTSWTNVPPSTSIGFNVRLTGLGASGTRDWPERTCFGQAT